MENSSRHPSRQASSGGALSEWTAACDAHVAVMMTASGIVSALDAEGARGQVEAPHLHIKCVGRRLQCHEGQLYGACPWLFDLWLSERHFLFRSFRV